MITQLVICVKSGDLTTSGDLEFYRADKWDAQSESLLLQNLQQLFSAIRPDGRTLQLHVSIEVVNYAKVDMNIRKLLKKEIVIKDQKLTLREVEVLGLIMQGLTNAQIAEKLFISFETVRSHRKNILEKTGMSNTAALISYYHQTFFEK